MVTTISDSNANVSQALAQYANAASAQPARTPAPASQTQPARSTAMLPVPVVQERSPQRTTAPPPVETTGINAVFEMNAAETDQLAPQGLVGFALEQYAANSTPASPYSVSTLDIYI